MGYIICLIYGMFCQNASGPLIVISVGQTTTLATKIDCCVFVLVNDHDYDDYDIHNLFPCEQHTTTMKMTMPSLLQEDRLTDEDS